MQLRRTVTLKVVVTEKFKEETLKALDEALEQLYQARSQIDFRSRIYLTELQRQDLSQAAEFRRRIEAEKRRQDEMKEQLLKQREEITALELGSEYTQGTLEGFVDIQVGDNLQAKLTDAEIVVKDDQVVELREPQPSA
ncbi:MAG TPA: YlqD family protein [Armatimonadota bacterium]|nr:YlqD family protein [Armatimonadota bacterium]